MSIIASAQTPLLLSAIRELALYRDEDEVATAFNVGNAFFATNEIWRSRPRTSAADIAEHYRTSVPGVSQQVFANYGIPSEVDLRAHIDAMAPAGSRVLDFGAGIGSQLLPLVSRCDCTHVDVGGVQADYARWRYDRAEASVEMHALPDDDLLAERALGTRVFDLVLCTEVLEHVTDPVALVERLSTLVRREGLLIATVSFDDGEGMMPMHLNLDRFQDESFVAEVLPRFGFCPSFPPDYWKR